jgi:hypothetical protein
MRYMLIGVYNPGPANIKPIHPFLLVKPFLLFLFTMLLGRFDAIPDISDSSIVIGSHKCHPTECVLQNNDPLTHKRARKTYVAVPMTASNVSGPSSEKENLTIFTSSSLPHLTHPIATTPPLSQSTQPANSNKSSDSLNSNQAQAIVVDDSSKERSNKKDGEVMDEEDNAELGILIQY